MMPIRSASHRIADRAVSAVTALCNRIGWACEVVVNDYGEDLLVQPTLADRVDNCRLWIQVKGTEDVARFETASGLSLPVSFDHAVRWTRSADLVVVALWDVSRDND